MHERFLLREDNTYLDRFGNEQEYVAQPEDFGEGLYDGSTVDEVIAENKAAKESLVKAEERLEKEGVLITDRAGFTCDRVVFRPGVTVEGGTGGWGQKGKAAIDTAHREEAEEAGVRIEQLGGIHACGDRSWESPIDGHFYSDLTDFVAYEEQELEEGEMINPEIAWTNINEFDWNLMPDVHLLVSALSAISDMNLISAFPLD